MHIVVCRLEYLHACPLSEATCVLFALPTPYLHRQPHCGREVIPVHVYVVTIPLLVPVTDFHNLNILYDISNHFNTSNSIYSDFTGFLQIFPEPLEP